MVPSSNLGLQPQIQLDVARFKDGADLDGERLAARIALPNTHAGALTSQLAAVVDYAAVRAVATVRPKMLFDVIECSFFVVEVRGGKGAAHAACLRDADGYVKYNNATI